MIVIKFGKWEVMGTGRYYYTRIGVPFSKTGFPFGFHLPLCVRRKAETSITLIFDKYGLWDRSVTSYSINQSIGRNGPTVDFSCTLS